MPKECQKMTKKSVENEEESVENNKEDEVENNDENAENKEEEYVHEGGDNDLCLLRADILLDVKGVEEGVEGIVLVLVVMDLKLC